MLLSDLATTSAAVATEPGRSAKARLLAALLVRSTPEDAPLVIGYLAGDLRQRRTGLGYASLQGLPPPAEQASLLVQDVDAEFERLSTLSGTGSTSQRRAGLASLMARATATEQRLLAALIAGELRQGALDGVMLDALALAGGVAADDLRAAHLLAGSLPALAGVLRDGPAALGAFRLTVGRPLQPMLAKSAPDLATALDRVGPAVGIEWKLDGIRVQVHRSGDDVRVFSRSLDDISGRVPDVVEAAKGLAVSSVVLDAEAILLGPRGRPRPFQETASRLGVRAPGADRRAGASVKLFAFDLLHLDGSDVLAEPASQRSSLLADVVPAGLRVPRLETDDRVRAQAFADDAIAGGHEGVMVKSLQAPYLAGRRGDAWIKVKPRHTLDLVVIAAEWGHGRRTGWLSNLHLAARDPDGQIGTPGGFVMLGKTFKGMTDAMLAEQTRRLLELATGPRDEWVVVVRPEFVVEVAFDGVQTSSRYPGGMALRFARVLRHRPDKSGEDADTVDAVRQIHLSY